MGLLGRLFGMTADCPACDQPGARLSLFGVRCTSRLCIHYDPRYAQTQAETDAERDDQRDQDDEAFVRWQGARSVAFEQPTEIQYVNFRGRERTFTADARSLRVRGRHLSACVAPTGQRIALALDRIVNLAAIQPLVAACQADLGGASPREAYVIRYHRVHGTSSALYTSLRAKYPHL